MFFEDRMGNAIAGLAFTTANAGLVFGSPSLSRASFDSISQQFKILNSEPEVRSQIKTNK